MGAGFGTINHRVYQNNHPNTLIDRTVWCSPQGSYLCARCKHFVFDNPNFCYDPATPKESYTAITEGSCGNLRVLAAFNGEAPTTMSYYYCNYYEDKEKENG